MKKNTFKSGFEAILEAANYLEENGDARELERNNFHGYARSPVDSDENSVADTRDIRRKTVGRDLHNKLEKSRRAQMKDHFNFLKSVVPSLQQKKHSSQSILKGSQKFIQTMVLKDRKFQQELQDLARVRAALTEKLSKAVDEFEKRYGFPARVILDRLNKTETAEDNVSEAGSTSTMSATEGPDNIGDFDDEEAESSPVMPSPTSQITTKGIPHSVIRETPLINQRQHMNSAVVPPNATASVNQAIPQATVKKLHAKLTSTKQTIYPSQGGTTVVANTPNLVSLPEGKVQIISVSSSGIPAASNSKVPIPVQSRPMVQSLLTSALPHTLPTPFMSTHTTAAGVMVAAAVQANSAIVTAGTAIPQLGLSAAAVPVRAPIMGLNNASQVIAGSYTNLAPNVLGHPSMYSGPSILVKASGNGQYMIPMRLPVTPPNVIVMPNYPHNPPVSKT